MIRLFVRHRVADYDVWRKGYDEAADTIRRGSGIKGHGVYQALDDPNDVTVWHDYETPEEAKAFSEKPELREAMVQIGVLGEPTVWITRDAT